MDGFENRVEMGAGGGGGEKGGGRELEDEDGEGGKRWRGGRREEGGGERVDGGFEEVGEALEDGHLVDELVDVGGIGGGSEADAGEERVSGGGGVWESNGGVGRRRRWRCSCHFPEVLRRF